jgi:hypothetical protein
MTRCRSRRTEYAVSMAAASLRRIVGVYHLARWRDITIDAEITHDRA